MNATTAQHHNRVDRSRRWMLDNLFSSTSNTVLTVVAGFVLFSFLYWLIDFVLVDAEWGVVNVNRRLIFLGRFPQSEEWRVWPPLWGVMGLGGLSYGLLSRASTRDVAWLGLTVAFILVFLAHGSNGLLFGGSVVLAIAAYGAGREANSRPALGRLLRRVAVIGWLLIIPFTLILIAAFGGVKPALWGGLLLNVMLGAIGIGIGLPLGILLALARASSLPVLKGVATAVIEITRGGPLVAWLFISRFILPEFIPDAIETDPIINAMVIVSLFTGAYIAEIVRGGLQSVPRGQVEAAHALGLGTLHVTAFIVLPQAIKAVVPALVSQLISLWKDTTLFSVLSFTDALGGAQAAVSQPDFVGRQKEALFFIALLFWSVAFGMSRLSQRFEKALGIGVR